MLQVLRGHKQLGAMVGAKWKLNGAPRQKSDALACDCGVGNRLRVARAPRRRPDGDSQRHGRVDPAARIATCRQSNTRDGTPTGTDSAAADALRAAYRQS